MNWWCLAPLLAISSSLQADIDISEYETKSSLATAKAQRDFARQIEAEKAEEQEREAQLIEQAQALEIARRIAEEKRPGPERLTEARCTLCHAAIHFQNKDHTLLGWWFVVLRMKQVNKAPLSWKEAAVIAEHLSDQYPATSNGRLSEWGALFLAVCLPAAGFVIRRRKRSI